MTRLTCENSCKININNNIDVLLLAGGKGSRLKKGGLVDLPKPLVPIQIDGHNIPMIENAIRGISTSIRSNLIILTSLDPDSRSDMVEEYILKTHPCGRISFSVEDQPLGTAGASNKVLVRSSSNIGIISPTDTLFPFHLLPNIVIAHTQKKANVTWVVTSQPGKDAQNTGKILTDKQGYVLYDLEVSDMTLPLEYGTTNLSRMTSVGVVVTNRGYFTDIFGQYFDSSAPQVIDLYRQYIPKLLEIGEKVDTFDIKQPAQDLGTIDRLNRYGRS